MNGQIKQVAAALNRIADAISNLRQLGVVRSRKLTSDFAEWLVVQIYEGTLAESRTQQGWDVQAGNENVQVKVSSVPESPANRWSYVNDPNGYDSLVLVVLTDQFKVREFYKIPSSIVTENIRRDAQGLRLNWSDVQQCRISRDQIPNIYRLSMLFETD